MENNSQLISDAMNFQGIINSKGYFTASSIHAESNSTIRRMFYYDGNSVSPAYWAAPGTRSFFYDTNLYTSSASPIDEVGENVSKR